MTLPPAARGAADQRDARRHGLRRALRQGYQGRGLTWRAEVESGDLAEDGVAVEVECPPQRRLGADWPAEGLVLGHGAQQPHGTTAWRSGARLQSCYGTSRVVFSISENACFAETKKCVCVTF